jgi:hypothetical protein
MRLVQFFLGLTKSVALATYPEISLNSKFLKPESESLLDDWEANVLGIFYSCWMHFMVIAVLHDDGVTADIMFC